MVGLEAYRCNDTYDGNGTRTGIEFERIGEDPAAIAQMRGFQDNLQNAIGRSDALDAPTERGLDLLSFTPIVGPVRDAQANVSRALDAHFADDSIAFWQSAPMAVSNTAFAIADALTFGGASVARAAFQRAVLFAEGRNIARAQIQPIAASAVTETRFVSGATVTPKGKPPMTGSVDVGSTLDRIRSGGSHPHPNDGSVFRNKEGLLPSQPQDHYREFVHPTPGVSGAGPQRVVTGGAGELFYTPDHYKTFVRLN